MAEPLALLVVAVVASIILVALDLGTVRMGFDSRPGIGDDHRR